MVMDDDAAIAFPATGEVPSLGGVRGDPVRAFIRRPRPVAVVPPILRSLRILVALDPYIAGAGLGRHAVGAWGRRRTDADAQVDLGRGCRGSEEQCRDGERLKEFFHERTVTDSS